jgi:RND family efflux transporter MFP subunit
MSRFTTRYLWKRTALSVLLLVTVAVTWLLAHEGHAPVPTRGAQVDLKKGVVVLSAEARAALDVRTAVVQRRSLKDGVLAQATLDPPWQKHAYASARLAGRIAAIHVRPGQTVTAGQVLAEIESVELESLRRELLVARNDLSLSEKVVAQVNEASKEGVVPVQTALEARTRHRLNQIALEIARARWLALELPVEETSRLTLPVRSPIAGTVIHADQQVGKVIEPAEHLFEIVDLSMVWARLDVVERDLHRAERGSPVELTLGAYPGEVLHGQVQVKGLSLDHETHLGRAWVELVNPATQRARWRPGQSGHARLLSQEKETSLVVPVEALVRDGVDNYVFVEEENARKGSRYRKQSVVLGRQTQEGVELRGGELFQDDRVVTRGSRQLGSFFVPGVLKLSPEMARTIGLQVEPAAKQLVEEVIEIDGEAEVPPQARSFIATPLAGTLEKVHVDRAQAIQPGKVLAEIASLELQNWQLEFLRSEQESALLEETLARLVDARGSVPARLVQEAKTKLNASRIQVESLRRKLELIGLTDEELQRLKQDRKPLVALPLRARSAGSIVNFSKVLGQAVKAEEPLLEVHDLGRVWVRGFVPERSLGRMRVGQKVRVRLTADPRFLGIGTIARSSEVLEADNRTLAVWVELDAPTSGLLHNQLARLAITVSQPAATLAVPRAAIVREGSQAFVFEQKQDGSFERRAVTTGRADDRFIEITSGLSEGQLVVVRGAVDLRTAHASIR